MWWELYDGRKPITLPDLSEPWRFHGGVIEESFFSGIWRHIVYQQNGVVLHSRAVGSVLRL
jgi:hypothetical protein